MILLTLARLAAWLEVSKKFSSRKESKQIERVLSLFCVTVQTGVLLYGIVVLVMELYSDHCADNSKSFNQLVKLTVVYLCIYVVVNFIYTLFIVKSVYKLCKRKFLF